MCLVRVMGKGNLKFGAFKKHNRFCSLECKAVADPEGVETLTRPTVISSPEQKAHGRAYSIPVTPASVCAVPKGLKIQLN